MLKYSGEAMKNLLAKGFHLTVGRLITFYNEQMFSNVIKNLKDGLYYVSPKPPFVSQLANADRTKTDGYYLLIHDEKAMKRFGTSNLEEFSYWAWRACGIAGVQMVLMAQLESKFKKSTMDLIAEGLAFKGYDTKKDFGWFHQSLVDLADSYGVDGRLAKFVSPSQIASLILDGNYVLSSVKSQSGGHLFLIYGFEVKGGKIDHFIVHDPYTFKEDGEAKEISKKRFEELSTRRVIILESKED